MSRAGWARSTTKREHASSSDSGRPAGRGDRVQRGDKESAAAAHRLKPAFPSRLDSLHEFRLTLGDRSIVVKGPSPTAASPRGTRAGDLPLRHRVHRTIGALAGAFFEFIDAVENRPARVVNQETGEDAETASRYLSAFSGVSRLFLRTGLGLISVLVRGGVT